jgi:LPXTG-site transpeptidase (sortase) family protein
MARVLALAGAALVGIALVVGLATSQSGDAGPHRLAAPRQGANTVSPAPAFAPGPGGTTPLGSASPYAGGTPTAQRNRGLPRTLVIRSLNVRAPVTPIRASDGVLLPPDDPTTVGWWRDGARPGAATGATVLTGHTVSTGGGVFDDLNRMHRGDEVMLTTTNGRLHFVVADVTAYPKQSLAQHARRLFRRSGPGRLVLVTCEDWNGEVYLSNQVVIAYPA